MIPYIDPARGDRVQTLLRGFRTTKCARRNFRCIGQDHAYVDVQRRYMIYHLFSPPFSGIPYSQSKYMVRRFISEYFPSCSTKTFSLTGSIGEANQ